MSSPQLYILAERLRTLLAPYETWQVECDGLARIARKVLTDAGIEHTCYVGVLREPETGKSFAPHCWLEVPDADAPGGGWRIDYRARMWLGPTAPHGGVGTARTQAWYIMAYDPPKR